MDELNKKKCDRKNHISRKGKNRKDYFFFFYEKPTSSGIPK